MMNINRNNYEEIFMLYVDHELSPVERRSVEAFVKENTDLESELTQLMQSKLQPDHTIVFDNKKSLLKQSTGKSLINESNYEEFFVLYVDGELSEHEKSAVHEYLLQRPALKQELDLLQQTLLVPDLDIVFENKSVLYKEEEKSVRIALPWLRMVAAAVVLLLAGFLVFNYTGHRHSTIAPVTEHQIASAPEKDNGKNKAGTVTQALPDSLQINKPAEIAQVKKEKKELAKHENKVQTGSKQMKQDEPLIARESPAKHEIIQHVPMAGEDHVVNTGDLAATLDPASKQPLTITDHAADLPGEEHTESYNAGKLIAYSEQTADNGDGISIMSSSSSGKNKMRGFFRKVTRVFEKRTGIDNGNSENAVLVGSFQIALK